VSHESTATGSPRQPRITQSSLSPNPQRRSPNLDALKVDRHPVVVFHQRVAGTRQPSFSAAALLNQQRFGIRRALMRRIRALLKWGIWGTSPN
jgi:hypothetical protein